jgi:hypothetical protein
MMAFQKPGQYVPIIDTGGGNIPVVNKPPRPGQYSPPQYNYAQQQEAVRRAELDRLARLDAQRIADMRRRAYQEQMQALQRQADEQRKQQAEMIKAQQEAEKRAAREAKDAKAYQQYYNNVPRKEEALRQMWEFGGLNYRPGSLIQNMAYQNYNTLYGPTAPQNYVRNIDNQQPTSPNMWFQWDLEQWEKPRDYFSWFYHGDKTKPELMNYQWEREQYKPGNEPWGAVGNQEPIGYNYPDYGVYTPPNYDYPDYTYPEPAKSWYENMLQWNIR